jgi:molybdenum cofactor guanylyltransferase
MTIAGCILAGGRSTRFGSDKALAVIGGKSLLDHAIARLAPQVAALAINTNSNDPAFTNFGLPLIRDATPDFRGPLAGVLAALEWALKMEAGAVVTVAVDTPHFPADLVGRLTETGSDRIAVAESATGLHPTFGLWPIATRTALSIWLDTNRSLRMSDFLDAQGFNRVWFDAVSAIDPFHNINSLDQAVASEAFTGSNRPS